MMGRQFTLAKARAAYRFATAAIDVAPNDRAGDAIWDMRDAIWDRMVATPLETKLDAIIKLEMAREAFDYGMPTDGGAARPGYPAPSEGPLAVAAGLRFL